MHDVDRESVASYIDGELIIPGNKGSFSDKQTTNYDIQSRKTNRTNKDGTKGKKSARGKNKEPLPKVEEIMKKSGM
jgi:ribosomal protein L19E